MGISKTLKDIVTTSNIRRKNISKTYIFQVLRFQNVNLLTNATVVDDAIRFVSSGKSKENLESSPNSSEDNKEESNEPDYDEDEDQLGEEKEEQTGEIRAATTNQVF
jgi:hypothetical protein